MTGRYPSAAFLRGLDRIAASAGKPKSAVDTAIDTMARLADEIAGIELSAVIAPPAHEKLTERDHRRSQAVLRLGDVRTTLLVVRDLLRDHISTSEVEG